ncbi:methyltransferase domain-containing protein [Oscillatoria sp. FACHB-1406]|uniref:methyltransferase domain-containing protein n=1 Tax=Oscillatoria sp. FACHB-1406 TaxID=2692846 RepID=UPI0016854D14|nr:methyltransferase domain-containing protein [Oscillatoria sp. FACHB-1406]
MSHSSQTSPSNSPSTASYNVETAVLERYEAGAKQPQASLCCPTAYEPNDLEFLPQEIIEKDYGCGDPTRYVSEGETAIDLGSGAGKNCYIIARKVGAQGKVIGVDFNDEMLNLARKYRSEIAAKIGYDNVNFVKGKIQDLKLNLERVESRLADRAIASLQDWSEFEVECDRLRREEPLIPSDSVDVVISNCVLNLVRPADKVQLFQEIYRVLKRGGRAVISDIVCDEEPTLEMQNDPELWSGCISGAFREDIFLKMFEDAGFYGIEILSRQAEPWQTIEGIEFRSVTVRAYKGKEGACWERNQAVIYKGPWRQVCDDDGHIYRRGDRVAVCDKTFQILTQPNSPYAKDIVPISPYQEIALEDAETFNCKGTTLRDPRATKGIDYHLTVQPESPSACSSESCC